VLERIREKLAQADAGNHPRFTASFGVTDSAAGGTLEQLMQIADLGLYASKDNGRDRISLGALDPTAPELVPVPNAEHEPLSERASLRRLRPLVHETEDEEPRPTGAEIR
jgi:hypothetical protein